MTANEREAYARITAAAPEHLIFPQVSLGSFIEPRASRDWALRNRYSQLTADFLICDRDSTPRAVVEIDDKSHAQPTAKHRDAKKDHACRAAGIQIIRWRASPLPTTTQMGEALRQILNPSTP